MLAVDTNGYLSSITNPAAEIHRFTSSDDGLLQTLITRGTTVITSPTTPSAG